MSRAHETQEHGMIEFDDGRLGIFHWTSVGYDSPMRWWRSSRFLAEKGMGITIGVGLDVEERLEPAGARRRSAALHHDRTALGAHMTAARWKRSSRTQAILICPSCAGTTRSAHASRATPRSGMTTRSAWLAAS